MPTIQTVCITRTTQFLQYIRFVLQGVQVTIDNTNRLYCRWFKLPPTIQTVCIVIDNTNRLYCSWLAIQTVCIVVGLQYKLFVLSAPQYKPFVLSSMQYKLFVLQLRATIQTVCIAGGSSYHTCSSLANSLARGQVVMLHSGGIGCFDLFQRPTWHLPTYL